MHPSNAYGMRRTRCIGAVAALFGGLGFTGAALAVDLNVSNQVLFSALDGSASDEDGAADGVVALSSLTVSGNGWIIINVPAAAFDVMGNIQLHGSGRIGSPSPLPSHGPDLTLRAGQSISVGGNANINADGADVGGSVILYAGADVVVFGNGMISAKGAQMAGLVRIDAGDEFRMNSSSSSIAAYGGMGGTAEITAGAMMSPAIFIKGTVDARGTAGPGGDVDVVARQGSIQVQGSANRIVAIGTTMNGTIDLTAALDIAVVANQLNPFGTLTPNLPPILPCAFCCVRNRECDDEDACTDDVCVQGRCIHVFSTDPCNDGNPCTTDACDPSSGGCVHTPIPGCGDDCCTRTSTNTKGSLLIFPNVEIRWRQTPFGLFDVVYDSFLTISNDFPQDVRVQYQFVNGDPPLDPVIDPASGQLLERAHPGWNHIDCISILTQDQPTYWSALTGDPLGCPPFAFLDAASPPGRPDPDNPGERVLRGFVLAWAINDDGEEIRWNHLWGTVAGVDYTNASMTEYNAFSYQARTTDPNGSPTDGVPGRLLMNCVEYDANFDMLLLDFYAEGSQAYSNPSHTLTIQTDLSLLIASADLRQDGDGPLTTKARFDIWNQNEVHFSGTERCVTCWDQTLLGNYDLPNQFLMSVIQTDKGKARVQGNQSVTCDGSVDVPLLGVSTKYVSFSDDGQPSGSSSMPLSGTGIDTTGVILYDVNEPPGE